MDIIFVILLIIALNVILFILHNHQMINKQCIMNINNKIEKYHSLNFKKEKDIDQIINVFKSPKLEMIDNPIRKYTYGSGNFTSEITKEVDPIINSIINNINKIGNYRFKNSGIERIHLLKDELNNKLYLIQFFAYETKKFYTLKFITEFFIGKNKKKINYVKLGSEKSLFSQVSLKGKEIDFNKAPFERCIVSKKRIPIQEPCKYDLHEWDRNSVNKQVKLKKGCNVINHSFQPPAQNPYVNPTIHTSDIDILTYNYNNI
jgi:hypothetical protein